MKVAEVMVRDVVTIQSDALVPEVAILMSNKRVSSAVVLEGKGVVGIVTERDFLERLLAKGKDPKTTKVKEMMSTNVVSIGPDASTIDALRLMRRHKFTQLPVIDKSELAGIVSLSDLTTLISTFFSAHQLQSE